MAANASSPRADSDNGEHSPLDNEPVTTATRTPRKRTVKVPIEVEVEEGDEDESEGEGEEAAEEKEPPKPQRKPRGRGRPRAKASYGNGNGNGNEDPPATGPSYEDDSPLDAEAQAQLSMVEVERTGPGEGPGWDGRNFNRTIVSYGRVGSLPRTRDVFDKVQALVGGGTYRFVTKNKPVVFKTLPGAPKPLPGEEPGYQAPTGFRIGAGGLYPEGFGEEPTFEFSADGSSTSEGTDGWIFNLARNSWVFYRDGRPSAPPRGVRPPTSAPTGTPGGMYDHGAEWPQGQESWGFKAPEDRVAKLEKLVTDVVQEIRQPRTDPMANFLQMQSDARATDEARRADERAAETARREDEREARRERMEQERQDRLAAQAAAKEAAIAQANAAIEVAKAQADAMKASATANAEGAKAMALMQKESSDQLVKILLARNEEGGLSSLLDQHAKITQIFGGKDDKSEVERIMGLVPSVIDSAVPSLANAWTQIRGGQQSQGGQGGASPEDDTMVNLSELAVELAKRGYSPQEVVRHIISAAGVANIPFDRVKQTFAMLEHAPPATVAAKMDEVAQNRPPAQQAKIMAFKQFVLGADTRPFLLAMISFLKGEAPPKALPTAPAKPAAPQAPPAPPAPPAK